MNEEMTAQEKNEAEIQMIENPDLDDRMNKMDQENQMNKTQDAMTKELEAIYTNYGIAECKRPKTLDDFEHLYIFINMECGDIDINNMNTFRSYNIDRNMANAMDTLLDIHGITYNPNSLHDAKRQAKNRWYADESLFERNVVIRESLRKSDDGLAFILVEYERNNPSDKQKHIITKDEVVSWLHMARASDDVIFKITGEIPPVYTDEDDCRF